MTDAFDTLMNNTCKILKRASGTDDYNQPSTQWEDQETGIACRVSRLSYAKKAEVGIQAAVDHSMLYMRPHTVSEHNMIELADGTRYEVVNVADPSLAGHHLEILVKEVRA
jgi:SPP1 family predicted phage head-tail adaptor